MIGDILLDCELDRERDGRCAASRTTRAGHFSSRAPRRSGASSPATGTTARTGFEGCRVGRAVGTYLHGPLLPRNPWLADWLIAQALARTDGEPPDLEPLPTTSRAALTSRSRQGTSAPGR